MKNINNLKKGSRMTRSLYRLTIRNLILITFVFVGFQMPLQAQVDQYTRPSWLFGVAGGANLNYYRGTTQQLKSDLTVPAIFHNGYGVGLYLAPLIEFHRPGTKWGFMLQAGYDNRKAKFDQVVTPCNCPADLETNLSYVTVEPSLRLAPFESNFYLYAGPRLAFNMDKSFIYDQGINPAFPDQVNPPEVAGDYSNIRKSLISMQIGAGYDIQLSSQNNKMQAVLSPFISFQPYFGQDPRSIETWNITTLRIGAALKFGEGHKIITPEVFVAPVPVKVKAVEVVVPEVKFTVNSPNNIAVDRRVRETFPLRNYVFFDLGSSEIPDRYVLLTKGQVKDFKEDQLEVFVPKKLSGRSNRQMTVYYNVLNILGDRMGKNPVVTVWLSGASMKGKADGLAMAESVKEYLVTVFGIDASRITTEGRVKPRIPSEQPGGTKELDLLREGDRRVTIWSTSPEILMEFRSGQDTPLKPVQIVDVQEAPLDSYVSFNVEGAKEAFTSWSLEIADEQGKVQNFGPYYQDKVSIPGKSILGTRPEGNYQITMVGKTKSGDTVTKVVSSHMVLWTVSQREQGMRFSIIYEFNNAEAITIYEKYLTEIVTPKIPKNAKVILHGYTDIIGDELYNQELSLARATDVKKIIENALMKAGRNDVKFEVYGFGEDQNLSQFKNDLPEERFYNRSVVIDIIPE